MKSESFKQKVIGVVRAWEDWAIYPNDYLVKLQNMFFGLVGTKPAKIDFKKVESDEDIDVDGKPLEEDEEDESQQSSNKEDNTKSKFVCIKWETVDPEKLEKQAITTSKWDFFDDNDKNSDDAANKSDSARNLTSYNEEAKSEDSDFDDDIDGKPMDEDELETEIVPENVTNRTNENVYDEEKRKFLREIEVNLEKNIRLF